MRILSILILGAKGQLGHELVRAAVSAGFNTTPWTHDYLDLRSISVVEHRLRELDFDVAVNCAAYTGVDAAESEPAVAFAINAYAVEAVARMCRTLRRPLVHLSTDYVFDGERDRPYRPEDPPAPINVYGASKLAGEALARRAHPKGAIVVRTSSLFGMGGAGSRRAGNFVEKMLRLGAERGRLQVVSDAVMSPTYAPDLARGIVALLRSDPPPGIYHMTNEGTASWWEFAREIFDQAGMSVQLDAIASVAYPGLARRPRYTVLDTGTTTERISQLPAWRNALERYLAERALEVP